MTVLRVVHRIRHRFSAAVPRARLTAMLRPRELSHQRVLHHQLVVVPALISETADEDEYGNHRRHVELEVGDAELEISAISLVSLRPRTCEPELVERARALLAQSGAAVLRGSCHARATMAVERLRAAGLEGRYVAGYRTDGARTEAHAWLALRLEDAWLDYDPTLDRFAPHNVTVAWGAGYDEVSPLRGHLVAEPGDRFRQRSEVFIQRQREDQHDHFSDARVERV